MVTSADTVEVYTVERIKRPKHAHGHEGDVIAVVVIGPAFESLSAASQQANRPLSASENRPATENVDSANTKSNTDAAANLSPEELENKLRNLNTVMYSAGIDNRIRAWDIVSMHCRGLFDDQQESAESEISTLVHVPNTRALITGHHDGTLFWWNTDNASSTRLPRAHSDAVTKIHHYQLNNTEILFSAGQDGILAVYDIETKKNEKIFHWQKSTVLSEKHGMSAIATSEESCYVGSSNGELYEYDIEMCRLSKQWRVCENRNIIDLKTDANFLFIGCEQGDVLVWELSLGFPITRIRVKVSCDDSVERVVPEPKCVGMYFHFDSNLLVIVRETRIIVYDYVLDSVVEIIESAEAIASFTFYNGSVFCGCKNAMISRIRLEKSFPDEQVTDLVKRATLDMTNATRKTRLKSTIQHLRIPNIQDVIAKRRALDELKPVVEWEDGDRGFSVCFNKEFK